MLECSTEGYMDVAILSSRICNVDISFGFRRVDLTMIVFLGRS
jgi:hypothetical protein